MKKIISLAALLLLIFIEGCSEKAPVTPDGGSKMTIMAYWNSSTDSVPHYAPMANAKVILTSEYGTQIKNTDMNGVLELSGLPVANYNVSVRMQHPLDQSVTLVGTMLNISTSTEKTAVDTIIAKPISNSGIAINEIYIGSSQKYFFDQFIELYNSSDSTKYLDGVMVMRFSGNTAGKGSGADEGDDGDIDGATYVFKFPGNPGETNYPFPPGKFIVLAQNAINHTASGGIDLSHADWEFFNQYSTKDMDNQGVPNITSMRSDKTTDFIISLTNDVIIVSNGKDQNWQDGIDISTILDGVEYQTDQGGAKTLDQRVDRSFVIIPSQMGRSFQRRAPGEDTNDASLDWEGIPYPTPGSQK